MQERNCVRNASGHPWLSRADGLLVLTRCMRLDPRDPFLGIRMLHVTCCHYFCGEYETAVEAGRRAIRMFPEFPLPYRWLAAALGQLGRSEEAMDIRKRATGLAPGSFPRQRSGAMRPIDYAHFAEGLRKAGWID